MACVGLTASKGIRNRRDGPPEILFEHLLLGQIDGNFTKCIVVVPTVNEADVSTAIQKSTDNEFYRDDFAKIADMNHPAGRDSGSADQRGFIAMLLDQILCDVIRP